jgi:glycosyltransferase involved in cell wall biosynthesis
VRVLHIVKTAHGATWVLHLVRVLRAEGVDVVVALPSASDGLAPQYRACGCEVVAADLDFPARHPWRLPGVLRRCRQLVARAEPDLIHTHHVGTTFVTRLALGKLHPIPRVFQVAGPLHLEYAPYAHADVQLAGPRDFWIATCHWTEQAYLRLGIPPQRVFQTFAGLDPTRFRPQRSGRLRVELDLPSDAPLVGMVAYMYAPKLLLGQERGLKGHEDFIAALSLAARERRDVRGVIIGGPWGDAAWYERRLRYLGERSCNGTLCFLGHRSDVAEIYPDLDLAVVPSHSENLGGAVEPLLCSVPVVATNVGGLPDIVRDGETGWLVPPRNPAALAEAILDALSHREEALCRAQRGATLVRELLDVERTGRQTLAFYRQILAVNALPAGSALRARGAPA